MSQHNDLDDQLYILLASMKEYREAIADDQKRLEMFYSEVAKGVLEQQEKTLNKLNIDAAQAFKTRIEELDRATHRISYQFIGLYAAAFVSLVLVLMTAIFLFVPSLDEIQQRRTEVAKLEQYNLDLSSCDGKTCVRVMKKQCNYGKNSDYCVIDPK
jgi:flagellar biosynthesis/type III secretory pathway M-ring protein FliF/YscJ